MVGNTAPDTAGNTSGDGGSRHVVVVGGGIAGLAAAYFLRRGDGTGHVADRAPRPEDRTPHDPPRVTVLEGSPQIGGKLRTSEVAGVPVDEGADAMLVRRPEAVDLAGAVGLGEALVAPAEASAAVYSHGALRSLPSGQVMGVPGDLAALARSGVLSTPGLARVPLDLVLPRHPIGDDVALGAYVASRLGTEVVDRLVDPLLGGVYAGHAGLLSLDATVSQLSAPAREHRSLIEAVRSVTAAASPRAGAVFKTPRGGLGTLPPAVAKASGAEIRTGATVRGLRRRPGGWRLTIGPTRAPETIDADAVVLAVPATPANRLLTREMPAAAGELELIDYASVAIVTLAYKASAFPAPPTGSGYLVPAVEGKSVKAATFTTTKWPHLGRLCPDTVIVRCSLGRYGEEYSLQRSDDELTATAMRELAEITGVGQLPVDTRVSRWGGALPQYAVGHLGRVARIRSAVSEAGRDAGPLAVCGAAYDGVGIPACVATARSAAEQVLGQLPPLT